jgi:putative ABC transport system permease protein
MLVLHNFRYSYHILRRSPGFACLAVLILALGIAANTAMFSLVDTILLRPLPYQDPGRVVMLWQSLAARSLPQIPVSQADFADLRKQATSFESMAAFYLDKEEYGLTGAGDPEQVRGMAVTANLFPLLGTHPALGRGFLPDEGQETNALKVILSYGLWQRRFGGNRAVIGNSITLDRQSYSVVGVMPRGFSFPPPMNFGGGAGIVPSGKDLWVPLVLDESNRDYHPLAVVARLKNGGGLEQARAEVSTLAHGLEQAYPKSNGGVGAALSGMLDQVVWNVRPALLVLLGAVGCVLLIACVNVANLLLARAATRRKELAVRAALGARRLDLIQQMLFENLGLAICGGALGVLLAVWAVDLLRFAENAGLPRLSELSLNSHVLAFAAGLSIATGLAAGLLPALSASRTGLNDILKQGSRTLAGGGHGRLRDTLVVCQISLALLLLAGAGLLIRSFQELLRVDPGFESQNLLTMELRLPRSHYAKPEQLAAFETELLDRIRSLQGIESAGAVNSLPVIGFQGASLLRIEGRPVSKTLAGALMANQRVVSPGYFGTMKIPLIAGRDFTAFDTLRSAPVTVINQTLASRYFPGENPIGKRIMIDEPDEQWQTIIGVIGDVHHSGLSAAAEPEIFSPYSQGPWSVMAFVVRTRGNPEDLAAAVRSQLWTIDKDQPVSRMSTMDKILSDSLAARRLNLLLLGSFAGMALLLALIGIYGVVSYTVVQRSGEIAIRMAVGAQRSNVWKLILSHTATLAALGIGIGLIATLALTRSMAGLLFHVRPVDPLTLTAVAIIVMATSLLASYLPARRATRIDPMDVLRD